MRVKQAYRFTLDPTNHQRGALAGHAGAARFAYNWGLDRIKAAIAARDAEYKATGTAITHVPSAYDLSKAWNEWKTGPSGIHWWSANSKCVYQQAFRDLDRGIQAFWDSRSGRRSGRKMGFPRYKKKGRGRDSFRLVGRGIRCDGRTVTLPKLGTLRACESTRKLARRVSNGTAKITSATVSRTADRWHVSFAVEVERHVPDSNAHTDTIGVDLGINRLATLSNGTFCDGPKALTHDLEKLRRANRSVTRKQKGSANRVKAKAKLARKHARIANIRRDHLHKLTTTLTKNHGRVVIEDLHVTGMLQNRRLARAIGDAGWGMLRRMLIYKAAWYGCELVVADRWFASSKTCSRCGTVKAELALRERVFPCEACGLLMDRDLNAANNLAAYAGTTTGRLPVTACGGSSAGPTGNGRVELPPAKQEPDSTTAA